MLESIKKEFPIKSILEGSEIIAIGNSYLDPEIFKNIFGTDNYDDITENLVTVREKGKMPYIGYRIATTKKIIPISTIEIRDDRIGYGNYVRFDMRLNKEFADILEKANYDYRNKV